MKKLAPLLFVLGTLAPINTHAGPEIDYRADLDGDTWAELFDIEANDGSLSLTIRRPDLGEIAVPNFAKSVRPHVWASVGNSVTLRTNSRWSHPHFYEQTITISFVNNKYVVSRVQRVNKLHGRMLQVSTCDINFVTGQGSYLGSGSARVTRFTFPAGPPLVSAWPAAFGWPAGCGV
jgi:hypothetical protein